ncbi:MAG TPA: glycosyltransferase family 2 protein [Candidatus Limnocylindrales bacterium]|nr:glycosyltransferase family 2 protein [Candidatus Limnocylindrales bacterium]
MDLATTPGSATSPPTARDRSRVSVVIPAKNEARNIGWVLRRLPDSVDEVVIVDGSSTDGTLDVARSVRPDLVAVDDREPGKGCALRAGVEAATGDYVVMLDADGSMDPREIDRFIAALEEGHDLAKGSRFVGGGGTADMTPLRDAGNKGLLLLSNVLFGRRHTDLCYGFAAFRRAAFQDLELTAQGFEIEAQLFLRATRRGLRVTEVASFEAPRRYGNSNLNTFRDGWRVLKTIVGERLRGTPKAKGYELDTGPLFAWRPAPSLMAIEPALGGAPPEQEVGTTEVASTDKPSPTESLIRRLRLPATRPEDDGRTRRPMRAPDGHRFRTASGTLGRMPLGRNMPD